MSNARYWSPCRPTRLRCHECYEVLYLLDALEHFEHVAGIVSSLSRADRIPPNAPVGIAISIIVYGLSRAGRLEEAGQVLMHDPAAYPPPWNQLDALGRAYLTRGTRAAAARRIKLSLKAKPDNELARKKLAELEGARQ